jgi:putative hydrolase of the HAD superfamily
VSLDVGGVLTVPDQGFISHALARHGVPFDHARFDLAHYHAMAEVERCRSLPEEFTDYQRGLLHALDVPEDFLEPGGAVLIGLQCCALWCQRVPGSMDAARRLAAAGLRLGITSNADGTIEEMLRRHEIAQLGSGPGIAVDHITDSGVLGVNKPDPAMFLATAAGLRVAPERVCHIGDSASFDAEGAAAVGMLAVHVDPLGSCPGDHHHVGSLAGLADLVDQAVGTAVSAGVGAAPDAHGQVTVEGGVW